jgi:hypothetical protein
LLQHAVGVPMENQFAGGAFHYCMLAIDGHKFAADVAKWKVK